MKRAAWVTALAFAAVACTEKLENDTGCPILCPQAPIEIQTVTLEAVVLDTTVEALKATASEPLMLLAHRPDTVDTRIVIRFDSLPQRFRPNLSDTTTRPITVSRNATLRLRIAIEGGRIPDSTTIELFDVDTTAADTDFSALLPLFRSDRRIGRVVLPASAVKDSILLPVSDSAIVASAQAAKRFRIGVRLTGTKSAFFFVHATESGSPARMSFRPSTDTTVAPFHMDPFSKTPERPDELRENLRDFQLLALAPARGAPTLLNVGALPARRTYLRFDIPSSILDSTTVIRASLLLTQAPNRAFSMADTMGIAVNLVLAGPAVTDVTRAATLLADPLLTGVDTLTVAVADTGERLVDIANLLRFWRTVDRTLTIPAVALTSTREHGSPLEARFFSREAVAALRPRLRISYAPKSPPGLP